MNDFSFVCKYCNKLYEISLNEFDEPIRNLILKVKEIEKDNNIKQIFNYIKITNKPNFNK